eukprot:COSAG01_NODE_21870_length_881_cov_1.843990_1_plen_67_part_10
MGAFIPGHQWAPPTSDTNRGCFSYGHSFANTSADEAAAYLWIVGNLTAHPEISASIYTQIVSPTHMP